MKKTKITVPMGPGYLRAMRSDEALELIKANLHAFVLAYIIARRAWWKGGYNQHDLGTGEAFLGDYRECGMSEQQYRTAKKLLAKARFAKFKSTKKGTIARLTDTRLFDVLNQRGNGQATTKPRPTRVQITTNETGKENLEQLNSEPLNSNHLAHKAVNFERSQRCRLKLTEIERARLHELGELLGSKEMEQSTACWISQIRKKPECVRIGIKHLRDDLVERKDIKNPAAWLLEKLNRWTEPPSGAQEPIQTNSEQATGENPASEVSSVVANLNIKGQPNAIATQPQEII
ncbi:MAG: hypothetical protein U1F83_15395 [Verrucomicrobiota bacterium]